MRGEKNLFYVLSVLREGHVNTMSYNRYSLPPLVGGGGKSPFKEADLV